MRDLWCIRVIGPGLSQRFRRDSGVYEGGGVSEEDEIQGGEEGVPI